MDDPLESEFLASCSKETIKKVEAICRICLAENPEDSISLFSHFEDQTVAQILSYCTSLEVLQIYT